MPHRLRQDRPGTWHHVFARGMARRTVFESARDVRVFKCLLAKEVRRRLLEIHAFSFLTTHVHLLVRSPEGHLSRALKRVFNGYVRWFNRSRRRDGSLFRGRFGSRLVTSDIDRVNVVAYIDSNAVGAGLARTPEAYAHGSALHWAGGCVPPWLATWFVADVLGVDGAGAPGAWVAYERTLSPRAGPALRRLIDARLSRRDCEADPLDDLVGAAPESVQAWMRRKAALADQTRPGLPVLDPQTVVSAWRRNTHLVPGEQRSRRGRPRPLGALAQVALLRDLSGLRYDAIAARLATSGTEARLRYRLHAQRLNQDGVYAAALARIAGEALTATHRRLRLTAYVPEKPQL